MFGRLNIYAMAMIACLGIQPSYNIAYTSGNEMYGNIKIGDDNFILDESSNIVYKTRDGSGMGMEVWEENGKLPMYDRNTNTINWVDIP